MLIKPYFQGVLKWVRINEKCDFRAELRADRAEQMAERQYTDSYTENTNFEVYCYERSLYKLG